MVTDAASTALYELRKVRENFGLVLLDGHRRSVDRAQSKLKPNIPVIDIINVVKKDLAGRGCFTESERGLG
jgi:hypothetical protein